MVRQKKKKDALSHLEFHEGDKVLQELLKRHPELSEEAEKMAESVITDASVKEIIEDMKRRKEAGSETAAEKICLGIVLGLYRVKDAQNDGAMGWAPDFPAEAAGKAISDFIELFPQSRRFTVGAKLLTELKSQAGEWVKMLERVVQQASLRSPVVGSS